MKRTQQIEIQGKKITVEVEAANLVPFNKDAFAEAESKGEVVELE